MKEDVTINKIDLLSTYKNASSEQKEILEHLFGSEVFKPSDVRDRIKTFEDAAKAVGIDDPKEWEEQYSDLEPDVLAYFKLRIITAALNEGWEPQFTKGELHWYFWYDLITKEQYDRLSAEDKSRVVGRGGNNADAYYGLVYSNTFHGSSYSHSGVGSRLAFKNEKLAEYARKQFLDIYADFCFKPKEEDE